MPGKSKKNVNVIPNSKITEVIDVVPEVPKNNTNLVQESVPEVPKNNINLVQESVPEVPKNNTNLLQEDEPEVVAEDEPEVVAEDEPVEVSTLPNPFIMKSKKKYKNKIALIMMVKNESLRIHVSLNSVLGFVSTVIIYDTGSTDDTIAIIIKFCKKYKLSLYLKQGIFENFSISRNILLDFADTVTEVDFLLLLDCNDELQNGPALIKFCSTYNGEETGFFLMQRWKAMIFIDYYNVRLVKARHKWRYIGAVHEYIMSEGKTPSIKVPEVIVYQDRTQDDNKSLLRFAKDRDLLTEEYNSPDKSPRTVYYLAQTYECMGIKDEAIKYYSERIHLDGFFEERYHAAYHVAQLMREKGEPFEKYSGFYMKSLEVMHRAEPLVRLGEHYISARSWIAAYYVLQESCKLDVPECGLFVDIELYKYYRWHLVGIVAFYVREFAVGLNACEIAIKHRTNPIDLHNREFYKNALSHKSDCERLKLM